jgi:hypothetical protein
MRILFVNEIEGAVVTSVNGSLNYPAESIYHPFLRKKFKSLFDNDVLTIDLSETVDMNCFFMGFHNVTAGTVSFFDGALSPVGTPIDLASALGIFTSYFSTISVKRIVVEAECAGSSQLYIGGIGAGVYQQMPLDMTNFAPFAVVDGTTVSQSVGGQVSRNRAPALRSRTWTWPTLDQTAKNDLDPYVLDLGIGKPVWMDLFEGEPDFDPPMYAAVTTPRELTNPAPNRYVLTVSFQEAR